MRNKRPFGSYRLEIRSKKKYSPRVLKDWYRLWWEEVEIEMERLRHLTLMDIISTPQLQLRDALNHLDALKRWMDNSIHMKDVMS